MKRANRFFALYLQSSGVKVLEAEHGLLLEEAPLALRQGKHWLFGAQAAHSPLALHLFQDEGFPLSAYFRWLLERFYALRKLDLLLLLPDQQSLSRNLWTGFLKDLGLASFTLATPLDCLVRTLKTGLLIYLEEGLASGVLCRRAQVLETFSIGYGRFLTRALRHQVLKHYDLRIESGTAAAVWQKLAAGGQVTVTGERADGKAGNQMLIFEDLQQMLAQALQPLLEEIVYLQALYPDSDCCLLGADALHPGLHDLLRSQLPQPLRLTEQPERLVLNSIQHVLQELQT